MGYDIFMKPFRERHIQSDVCLKRQELIAKKSSQHRNGADWTEAEKAAFEAEWYENELAWIETIHHICGKPVSWEEIAAMPAPFVRGEQGPHERQIEAEYTEYKPTRMQKLLKQEAIIKQEMEERLESARDKDRQEYAGWKSLTAFAQDILEGNRTAYLRVLEELAPIEDLLSLGSGMEFSVLDAESVEVELDVNLGGIIPNESKRLTDEGSVIRTRFSPGEYHELELKYVCGSVFRIARELFALLPLTTVLVHARDTMANLESGQEEYVTILSVCFDRQGMPREEPALAPGQLLLEPFSHHMQFETSTGFHPVDPVTRQFIPHFNS